MLATSFYKAVLLLKSVFLDCHEFIRGSSEKTSRFLMTPRKHQLAVNLVSKSDD